MQADDPLPDLSADERALVFGARERALGMLLRREPLRDILAQLTMVVEALGLGKTVASILVLDRQGLLRNGASPNLPSDYLDAIDRLQPRADVGTCAAAAATGEAVETPSFLDDARWSGLRHLPLSLGLLGAWSQPIKGADGRVLGTLGTYFREHRKPTRQERQAVALLAGVGARVIAESVA